MGLHKTQKERLKKCFPRIVKDVNASVILDHLYAGEYFTKHEVADILKKENHRDQMRELMYLLYIKKPGAYSCFMAALREEEFEHVAEEIECVAGHSLPLAKFTGPQKHYKVILLGDSGVGKTSVLSSFEGKPFQSRRTLSVGFDFKRILVSDGSDGHISLEVWDTVGQEKFNSLTATYTRNAYGALILYDVNNKTSFNNLGTWISMLHNTQPPHDIDNIPFVFVGNKTDVEENEREVTVDEGAEIANEHRTLMVEASAKDSKNITEAFKILANVIETAILAGQDNTMESSTKDIRLSVCDSGYGSVAVGNGLQNMEDATLKKNKKKCC